MGYGPAESWTTAKVIEERTVAQLFGNGEDKELLVEVPGGERLWVGYWKEETTNH